MHKQSNQILVAEHSYTCAVAFYARIPEPCHRDLRIDVLGTSWAKTCASVAHRIEIRLRSGARSLLQAAFKRVNPQLS